MPDSISYVILSPESTEQQDKTSLRTNVADKVSVRTLSTDTENITYLQSTDKYLMIFREGETVQFTCTGYIGKPPGTFIWQIISPQKKRLLTYSNATTVVDQIPGICSFRGTSTLTVQISEDHFKAKFRCFEKSQADVLGMFVETGTLDIYCKYSKYVRLLQ